MFKPVIVSRRKDVTHDVEIWHCDVEDYIPDEFREVIFIITPPQIQQDEEVTRDIMRAGYHVEKLPEGNVYVVTSRVQMPDKFWIYHTPFVGSKNCAPSPQSDARYHLEYSVPYCGILWQNLKRPPEERFAQTSSHFHKKQSEKWLILNGSGTLLFRLHNDGEQWKTIIMKKGDCLEVPPLTEHQLRTSTNFSTLLVMTGDPNGFSLTDHVYVDPPPADMAIA